MLISHNSMRYIVVDRPVSVGICQHADDVSATDQSDKYAGGFKSAEKSLTSIGIISGNGCSTIMSKFQNKSGSDDESPIADAQSKCAADDERHGAMNSESALVANEDKCPLPGLNGYSSGQPEEQGLTDITDNENVPETGNSPKDSVRTEPTIKCQGHEGNDIGNQTNSNTMATPSSEANDEGKNIKDASADSESMDTLEPLQSPDSARENTESTGTSNNQPLASSSLISTESHTTDKGAH